MTEKADSLARDILFLSRNTLLVNLRFLDTALNRLQFLPVSDTTFETDGRDIYYTPRYILESYQQEMEIPVRDVLHALFHCIFRHMYLHTLVDREYWNLACDIAVEYVITGLGLQAAAACRQNRQIQIFDDLKKKIKHLTAEKIYHYLLKKEIAAEELEQLKQCFSPDSHRLWYQEKEKNSTGEGQQGVIPGEPQSGRNESGEEQQWLEISLRIQTDLETFSRQYADKAGNLIQNLQAVNRERYDYAAFLKKFASRGEVMKINDDEFDYIFYTYGLKLYDKMPLIEPLEYKEIKRIRDFVIAIDTSGSVSGELVQAFIQKTYNILKSQETFAAKMNLHIIQCDCEIQEDAVITTQAEFDRYLQTMNLRGFGGTDFRPVFSYVEELRSRKELLNLKGLIYFTDGIGRYPAKKPDYDTVFVFLDENYQNPQVPPWAMKLLLQKEEIG